MTRNLELYRLILMAMEECPDSRCTIRGLSDVEHAAFAYHVKLLTQAGLIEAVDASSFDGEDWLPVSITHEGHEFLDAIRENSIWEESKKRALSATGTITAEVLKTVAQAVIKGLLIAHNIGA